MKKIVKMSLVAAVAVAGLTTANAKPLVEAIKDVDVSGTVVYRYNDYNNDNEPATGVKDTSDTQNNYKIAVNLSSKVNDYVKFNSRFIIGAENSNGLANVGGGTQVGGDGSLDVTLSQAYFSYTGLQNTTVNIGKQGLTTPWTTAIDPDGNEQTGTGVLALSTWGPVTVAGAYFNQTNLNQDGTNATLQGATDGSSDVYTVGIIGNVGPVVLDAWYLKGAEIVDLGVNDRDVDTYTIGAKANFDLDGGVKLGLEARYTDLTVDGNGGADLDNEAFELGATLKVGIFDAKAIYVGTDEDGGLVALDEDAVTTFQGWNMSTNGKADADFYMLGAGVQATEKLHIALNYSELDWAGTNSLGQNVSASAGDDIDESEIFAQFTYDMSKNLSTYVRFGKYDLERNGAEEIEGDYRGRLQVQYSF